MYIVTDQKMDSQSQFSYGPVNVINMVSEITGRKVKKSIHFTDLEF